MKNNESEFTTIGQVLGTWGFKGKLKVSVLTDFPERFNSGENVYIDELPFTIEENGWLKGNALIKLKGIDKVEQAQQLVGKDVQISPSQNRPLAVGQYYHYQIAGLKVITTDGKELGVVTNVLTCSANDIYVIKCDSEEVLIPATENVVKSIDLDKKIMLINAIPGLLELNQNMPNSSKAQRRKSK